MSLISRALFPDFMGLSGAKAKKMLHEGKVHGKPITKKQRGYFGAVASGKCYSCKGKMGKAND